MSVPPVDVSEAKAGAAPVAPSNTCPLLPTFNEVSDPEALPICTAFVVVPATLTIGDVAVPVTDILLPGFTEVTRPRCSPVEKRAHCQNH